MMLLACRTLNMCGKNRTAEDSGALSMRETQAVGVNTGRDMPCYDACRECSWRELTRQSCTFGTGLLARHSGLCSLHVHPRQTCVI